jgi:transmembrane sensor
LSEKPSIPPFLLRPENGIVHDQHDQALLEQILSEADAFDYPNSQSDQQWTTLSAQISPLKLVHRSPKRLAMFRWVAAAVVVITVAFGTLIYQSIGQSETLVLHTENQTSNSRLTDGSQLQLNSHTVLEVQAMTQRSRVVYLKQGEVFCKVAHADAPFKLVTDKGIITVLGTEFNVCHEPNAPFSIFLKKGSIQFETGQQQVTLKPGDYLCETQKGQMQLTHIQDNRATAWVEGALNFQQTQLSEIIKVLEAHYNKSFVYDKQLANEKVTITIKGLNAQEAAQLLSKTIGHTVQVAE